MPKIISLKILKVQYGGDSIGKNLRLEIEIVDKFFTRDQDIKVLEVFEFNQEIVKLQLDTDVLEVPIRIKIIEKDILFSDSGEIKDTIQVDVNKFLQTFSFEIKVKEKNKIFSKSTAVFTITLTADLADSHLQQYNSRKSGENYNRFDIAITDTVNFWNKEFLKQDNPPPIPLDPNVVKAMVYVESKMGYYIPSYNYIKKHPDYYHSYPDVMQVADPNNDAIYALNNIYNPNPRRKKMGTEYEVISGQLKVLEYKEANGNVDTESIHWGVRWLYHVAQDNQHNSSVWSRTWKNWEDAIPLYNGGGDKSYKNKVINVYKNGVGENKFKLWGIGSLILLVLGITYGSLYIGLNNYNQAILGDWQTAQAIQTASFNILAEQYHWRPETEEETKIEEMKIHEMDTNTLKGKILKSYNQEDRDGIQDLEVIPYNSSLFATIIEDEKDWWEYFEIGQYKNGEVGWLKLEDWPEKAYVENSILSAKWVNLKGMIAPILEVYGITHMGNGDMYLFKVSGNKYSLIFTTRAVSGFWPTGNSPSQDLKKYGYANCQETFKNGKLTATYEDLNADGIADLVLTGATEVICDDNVVADIVPIREKFILNPDSICSVDKYLIISCK